MSNTSEQRAPTQRSWLTSASARQTGPLSAPPGQPTQPIAGQVSEHLARAVRRQTASHPPLAAPAAQPAPAAQAPAPAAPWPDATLRPPEHVLSSTTLLSAWLASTHTTWGEDQLRLLLSEQAPAPLPPTGPAFALFTLGGHRWGVPLPCLREVLRTLPPLTPLPFSPLWLLGIINVRSEPVGVVNLSELLLDPVSAASALRRSGSRPVFIAESDGILLALLVEEINETIFPEEHLLQPPNIAETRWLPPTAAAYLQATWNPPQAQESVLLLDLPRLLASLLQHGSTREAPHG